MNLGFLGDALDHWKGSLFKYLLEEEVLRRFAIDPMFSDQSSWAEKEKSIYARLMHVEERQLICHKHDLRNRCEYFREIEHDGDLFLDPDTGVATGSTFSKKHVRPQEVASLIKRHGNRLLVLYQHNARGKILRERVKEVLVAINSALGAFSWCSYESSSCAAAILFIARQFSRAHEVEKAFQKLLGLGSTKIRVGNFPLQKNDRSLTGGSL